MLFPLTSIIDRGRRPQYREPDESGPEWLGLDFDEEALFSIHYHLHSVLLPILVAGYYFDKIFCGVHSSKSMNIIEIELGPRRADLVAPDNIGPTINPLQAHLNIPMNKIWVWGDDLVLAIPLEVRPGYETSVVMLDQLESDYFIRAESTDYIMISAASYNTIQEIAITLSSKASTVSEQIISLIISHWQDRQDLSQTGLMSMYDSYRWAFPNLNINEEYRTKAFSTLGENITNSIVNNEEAMHQLLLDDSKLRSDEIPYSVFEVLTGNKEQKNHMTSLNADEARTMIRNWKHESRYLYKLQKTEWRPPFRTPDLKYFTYTELLFDAQEYNVIDFFSGINVLEEGKSIYENIPPDQRTEQHWAILIDYIPLRAPEDTSEDHHAALIAQELLDRYEILNEGLQKRYQQTLAVTLSVVKPSSGISTEDEIKEVWFWTNGFDFENYLLLLGNALCIDEKNNISESRVSLIIDKFLNSLYDPEWDTNQQGFQSKIAFSILHLLECVSASEQTFRGSKAILEYWDSSISGNIDVAIFDYLNWQNFELLCNFLRSSRKLDTWNENITIRIDSLYWKLIAGQTPDLHSWKDQEIEEYNHKFASHLFDLIETDEVGTDQSRYYHLLVGIAQYYDVNYDFEWRQNFDINKAYELKSELETDGIVANFVSEAIHLTTEEITEQNFIIEEQIDKMLDWLVTSPWIAYLQVSDNAEFYMQQELARIAIFNQEKADELLEFIINQTLEYAAFETAAEMFTDDEFVDAYEQTLLAMGFTPEEALTLGRKIVAQSRKTLSATGWLLSAAQFQEQSPYLENYTSFTSAYQKATGKTMRAIPVFRGIASFAVSFMLFVKYVETTTIPGGEDVTVDEVMQMFLALPGMSIVFTVDIMDIALVTIGGSNWSKIAAITPPVIDGWAGYFKLATISGWAKYAGARALYGVRWILGLVALTFTALIESISLVVSVKEGVFALYEGRGEIAKVHIAEVFASAFIIAGSLYTIGVIFSGTGLGSPIGAVLILVGVGIHIYAAFQLSDVKFDTDLIEMEVLQTITVNSPLQGQIVELPQINDEIKQGELLVRLQPSETDSDEERIFAEVESLIIDLDVQTGSSVVQDEPLLDYKQMFLKRIEGPIDGELQAFTISGNNVATSERIAEIHYPNLNQFTDVVAERDGLLMWYGTAVEENGVNYFGEILIS